MYDKPNATDLLDAARTHFEQNVVPHIKDDRVLYFQTLVAINVMKVVRREIELKPKHLRLVWKALEVLENSSSTMPHETHLLEQAVRDRLAILASDIRDGKYDDPTDDLALLDFLTMETTLQLQVANPKFLLMLAGEDQALPQ
jgi:hypothetical protein